jgi:hypothetical protein
VAFLQAAKKGCSATQGGNLRRGRKGASLKAHAGAGPRAFPTQIHPVPMKIILHTGAHFTDQGKLLKCLLRNRSGFAQRAISVPGPSRYRGLLKSYLAAPTLEPAQARAILIEEMLEDETATRLLLSDSNLMAPPRGAVTRGRYYPAAPARLRQLRDLFAEDQVEVFLALCDPTTFLPALQRRSGARDLQQFLDGHDPRALRWSDLIEALHAAAPDVPLTIWCNEDTPLIWAEIVRAMAGLPAGEKIVGGFTILESIMSRDGMMQFRASLKARPDMTEHEKRQVMAEHLEKNVIPEAIEEELDLPGWTQALIGELSARYDRDVDRIRKIPNVRLLLA